MAPPRGGGHNTLVWLGPREGPNVWVDRATVSLLPEEMKAMSASTSAGQGLNPATCPPARMASQLSLVDFLSSAFCPQREERFSSRTLARGCPFKARHCRGVQAQAGKTAGYMGLSVCTRRPHKEPSLGHGLCYMDRDSAWRTSLNSHSTATKVSPATLSSIPS